MTDDDRARLHELLGRTVTLGKHLVRLSSVKQDGVCIVHDATAGERLRVPAEDFLRAYGELDTPDDPYPEGAVLSQCGVRAETAHIGPRGGVRK